MAADIPGTVARLCNWFPGVEQKTSHGAPAWFVEGRQFASFNLNHHGDGHVGLALRSPPGQQADLVASDPEVYYVPAYSGPSGWTGIELNGDVDWADVVMCTADAWRHVAPRRLVDALPPLPDIEKPRPMAPEEIDPFLGAQGKKWLETVRGFALALPEVVEASQFGAPCFKAGKKTFAILHHHSDRFAYQVWVGGERQAMLTFDERYRIPSYIGKNGWIELDLGGVRGPDTALPGLEMEMANLAEESYRHFALKRMLKALDAGDCK